MAFYKFTNTVDQDEDPIFIDAASDAEARSVFSAMIGDIPASMLRVEHIETLPDDAELLNA